MGPGGQGDSHRGKDQEGEEERPVFQGRAGFLIFQVQGTTCEDMHMHTLVPVVKKR